MAAAAATALLPLLEVFVSIPRRGRGAPHIARPATFAAVIAMAAVAALASAAVADPSSDEVRSDLDAAQERYDEFDQRIGQAQNAYNDAAEGLEAAEHTLAELDAELAHLSGEADQLRARVQDHVRMLHKLGPGVELSNLVASDPNDAGLRSTTLRQLLQRQSADLESLTATDAAIAAAQDRQTQAVQLAAARTSELEAQNERLEQLFADSADEVDALEELLQLTVQREEEEAAAEAARQAEAERQAAATGSSSVAATGSAPSTRSSVDAAVQTALAQIGKPYSWGGTGPGSFDCSGLVTYAFRSAGISHLPRSSSAQYGATTRISRSDLRPGDLVFYHSPVSHVAIYIGGGRVVEAPNSGNNVRIRTDGLTRRGVVGFGRV